MSKHLSRNLGHEPCHIEPVMKSRKALHGHLLKTELHHGYFERIRPKVQNNVIDKHISMAASEDNCFLRTFLNGCFLKATAKICSN